jgi:protein-tyrosine phosphatase
MLGGFIAPFEVAHLVAEGIGAVVNVSSELYDPLGSLRAAGIAYLRVPCWDMSTPEFDDARVGVSFIAERIARGEKVYVHCASGVGRSVAITLCYMATHGGFELDDARALVRRSRPRIAMRKKQRRFVEAFVAQHRAESGTSFTSRSTS